MKSKTDKPLITFALWAYNEERFIREAIGGSFSQTYSPLEIILSDDCSSDHTFVIMKEMAEAYQGPHTIILNRNGQNMGIGGHVNRIMEIAQGRLIVAAAGDDVSMPARVEKIYQVYKSTEGLAKSIYSNCLLIDEIGKPFDLHFKTPKRSQEFSLKNAVEMAFQLSGSSHAWTREVFDVFGSMITPLTCEDKVIPFRSLLLGQIKYIHETLVMHRRHDKNTWLYKRTKDKRTKDVEREIEFKKFWIFDREAIYKNWIADLQTMQKLSSDRKEELACLQSVVYKLLLDLDEDIRMFNGNFIERVKIIAKNVCKKDIKLRNIRHKIGYFLLPQRCSVSKESGTRFHI
jgi:Glycosyltransferases involved in cell wall biogenesis